MISAKQKGIIAQAILDWLTATTSWVLLFLYRKYYVEANSIEELTIAFKDINLFLGVLIIPIFWLLLYFISGTYTDIYRKSRLKSLSRTFMQTLFGTVVIFFLLLLDDDVQTYKNYYSTFGFLFFVHFITTSLSRFLLLTWGKKRMHNNKVTFRTLLIGSNGKALDFYETHKNNQSGLAYYFVGFVNVGKEISKSLNEKLQNLGTLNELEKVIEDYKIEDIIIAIDSSEQDSINQIINELSGRNVVIKILPSIFDILLGKVKMSQVTGAPLIEIYPDNLPKWQIIIKRLSDIVVSSLSLIILLPFLIFIAIKVKLSSEGAIFYFQERIGHRGKPFNIIKFRSMIENAEANGPALSSENDTRITPWGNIMRKWRLDELPQFINVLKGDMSLIGPRPERQFYINEMMKIAPHCKQLQRVKPGITSLGMVKFGYAENVDEMVERLKYDLIYIESQSLLIDFKIFIYTINTLLKGRGK